MRHLKLASTNRSIWVSKEALGSQECNWRSWLFLKFSFNARNAIIVISDLSFFIIQNFLCIIEFAGVSTSSAPREITFYMVVFIPKKNGISLGNNFPQTLFHLGPPNVMPTTGKDRPMQAPQLPLGVSQDEE